MDVAYDKIQDEALSPKEEEAGAEASGGKQRERAMSGDLNTEIKEAYKAFSDSSWGARLGGLWGQVKKQGEGYYEAARKELSAASDATRESTKGAPDLISFTNSVPAESKEQQDPGEATATDKDTPRDTSKSVEVPESLSADILKEAEGLLARFRLEAAAGLKKVQKAEDAADEALLKFGTNIRDYLRDAVTITAPGDGEEGSVKDVLFESKDAEGRRVVHATRFDAQLHVIHANSSSFLQDPSSPEYEPWKTGFDVEKKTDAIAQDLNKFEELRRAMEKLVPEKVEYSTFWTRYYFLRHVIETEEQKRRELLQKTVDDDEEVKWDDDDEDEDAAKAPATPKISARSDSSERSRDKDSSSSGSGDLLKPARRSNEHSVAGSDASYDIVSAATSGGPSSPREEAKKVGSVPEQSDEEDWE